MKMMIVWWILALSLVYVIVAFTFWDLNVARHLEAMSPSDRGFFGVVFSAWLVFGSGLCWIGGKK